MLEVVSKQRDETTSTEEESEASNGLAAARVTLQGTGGALFGTTLTTASAGLALHDLSITPILVQFGALIAVSVTYSFLASTVVLPVVLVLWTRRGSARDAALGIWNVAGR